MKRLKGVVAKYSGQVLWLHCCHIEKSSSMEVNPLESLEKKK